MVLKVVPDEIMRGLELRKGTVDMVVNDLVARRRHQLARSGGHDAEAPGIDYAYVGVNMRDPILKDRRVRHALGYAIDRQAIVDHLRRGLARAGGRASAAALVGVRARRASVHARSRERARRCSTRPAIAIPTATGRSRGCGCR